MLRFALILIAAAIAVYSTQSGKSKALFSLLESVNDWQFAMLLLPFSVVVVPLIIMMLSPRSRRPATGPITHFKQPDATDVLIVGLGCAGAPLATVLARRGYRVKVIEKDMSEPHRIVGELLQPAGVNELKSLDLTGDNLPIDCLKEIDSQQITGYSIIMNDTLRLAYPPHEFGRAFHNGRFLTRLRTQTKAESNCQIVQGQVTDLVFDPLSNRCTGVKYTQNDQTHTASAALTVVADGCMSLLRKQAQTQPIYPAPSSQFQQPTGVDKLSSFVGLILTNCQLPTPLNGHVILADPTPILAYPISSTEVRMLIDFPNGTYPSTKPELIKHFNEKVRPQLPASMRPSFDAAVQLGSFSMMPNQSLQLCPDVYQRDGMLMIGDSANMRHPLTGGGMTVAFKDISNFVHYFTSFVRDCNDFKSIKASVQEHYETRHERVKVINILADALYAVFQQSHSKLRQACFDYLSLGGRASSDPVRFLSGLNWSQPLLAYHFFSVAGYGIIQAIKQAINQGFFWEKLSECVKMLSEACVIILPLLWRENANWRTIKQMVR